jgi:hypothetical protein
LKNILICSKTTSRKIIIKLDHEITKTQKRKTSNSSEPDWGVFKDATVVVHLRREDKCLTNGAKHPNTGNKFKNHQMSEESKKISKPH